jgi:hypothetical protein
MDGGVITFLHVNMPQLTPLHSVCRSIDLVVKCVREYVSSNMATLHCDNCRTRAYLDANELRRSYCMV